MDLKPEESPEPSGWRRRMLNRIPPLARWAVSGALFGAVVGLLVILVSNTRSWEYSRFLGGPEGDWAVPSTAALDATVIRSRIARRYVALGDAEAAVQIALQGESEEDIAILLMAALDEVAITVFPVEPAPQPVPQLEMPRTKFRTAEVASVRNAAMSATQLIEMILDGGIPSISSRRLRAALYARAAVVVQDESLSRAYLRSAVELLDDDRIILRRLLRFSSMERWSTVIVLCGAVGSLLFTMIKAMLEGYFHALGEQLRQSKRAVAPRRKKGS